MLEDKIAALTAAVEALTDIIKAQGIVATNKPEPKPEPKQAHSVTHKELQDLAMSLVRADTANGTVIRAELGKHGVKTITALPESALYSVHAALMALMGKTADEATDTGAPF